MRQWPTGKVSRKFFLRVPAGVGPHTKNAGQPGHVRADGSAGKLPARIRPRNSASFSCRFWSFFVVRSTGRTVWSDRWTSSTVAPGNARCAAMRNAANSYIVHFRGTKMSGLNSPKCATSIKAYRISSGRTIISSAPNAMLRAVGVSGVWLSRVARK